MMGVKSSENKRTEIASAIIFLGILISVIGLSQNIIAVTSSLGNFNVTPDFMYFNWSGSSFLLTSLANNTSYVVGNASTSIFSNYSQNDLYSIGDYVYMNDSASWVSCFNTTAVGGVNSMKVIVWNGSGDYVNYTGTMNESDNVTFHLLPYLFCPPGKYFGSIPVFSSDNYTDNLSVGSLIHIPISKSNTYDEDSQRAFFKGTLSTSNPLHVYYLNTTLSDNITSMYLNLTWSDYSKDIDLFLFNDTSLLAKSINRNSSEGIYYLMDSPPEFLKIVVYGNVSSNYVGNMYFSSLNSSKSSVDFGTVDPNQTKQSDFVLNNIDDRILHNVSGSVDFYHTESWTGSTPQTLEFLVPYFADKVRVSVNWTNASTKWMIVLRDVNGEEIGNSSERYFNANQTGVVMEEYVEHPGPFNTTNDGYWNITVINQTNLTDAYDVRAYVWIANSSQWVQTNFTETDINLSGGTGSSLNVTVNLTSDEIELLNGTYEGTMTFLNGTGWEYRVPFGFGVMAGNLLFNDTYETTVYYTTDNIGFNRIGADVIRAQITYNNTGGYPVYHTNLTSGLKLNISQKYIDFSMGSLPNPIPAGGNGTLEINFTVNTTKTGNWEGIYGGWIFFNTSSVTLNGSSYPFRNYNISLQVNLTRALNLTITGITPTFIDPPNQTNNVTTSFQARLANGTIISNDLVMNYSDFYNLYMKETNTSYQITIYNLTAGGAGGTGCSGGICQVKGSVPEDMIGGKYNLFGSVNWNTSYYGGTGEAVLNGSAYMNNVSYNESGILLSALNTTTIGDMAEGGSIYMYHVSLANYGPSPTEDFRVYFDKGSCYVGISTGSGWWDCSGGSIAQTSGNTSSYNVTLPGYFDSTCRLWFKIQTLSVSEDKSCVDGKIMIIGDRAFGNGEIDGIYINVINDASSNDTSAGPTTGTTTCSSNSDCPSSKYCSNGQCILVSCPNGYVSNHACVPYTKKLEIVSYPSTLQMLQGGWNTTEVLVKNSGNVGLTGKLIVTSNISTITSTVTPASHSLNASVTGSFILNFSVSNETEVGYYTMTIKAYYPDNTSVSDSKDIILGVHPLEAAKIEINDTFLNYTGQFLPLENEFRKFIGLDTVNFTKANRTYNSIINILEEIETYLQEGKYLQAHALFEDAENTLERFKEELTYLTMEVQHQTLANIGDIWTWSAIGIIIMAIIIFVVYLLLPPREGYHPLLGFKPKNESPVKRFFGRLGGHFRALHRHVKRQMNLKSYMRKEAPVKKEYMMEGYKKNRPFQQETLKDKFFKKVKNK